MFSTAQQQQLSTGPRVKVYEPHQRTNTLTEQVITKRQARRRQYEMTHPRFGYQRPVYAKYTEPQPVEQFLDYYGHGSQPDHYYPGLTPRDVLLARAQPGQGTNLVYKFNMIILHIL
jgi:hypothetical protein